MTDLKKHQIVALLSFITLVAVLFYLTYNTYVLEDQQYRSYEKTFLSEEFKELTSHENIYPGGYKIVSTHLEKNMRDLERQYQKHHSLRNPFTDSVLKSLFFQLQTHSPMDSIFKAVKKKYQLHDNLEYLLIINGIKLRFGPGVVTTLYDPKAEYPFLDDQRQLDLGYMLDGALASPLPQNRCFSISLGSSLQYSYDLSFAIYVDSNNRQLEILKAASPILLLTLFALSAVIFIYYVTFKNWIQQKKLTEMKSDFINSITHEFHTPIATIMVANKSLENERVLANKTSVKELTEVISRQSKRLEMLFGQVLDITKIDSMTIEKEKTDVVVLLKEVLQSYKLKVSQEQANIKLLDITEEAQVVCLNEFWFTTMLFNIFDNAIKYNDKAEKTIYIQLTKNHGGLQLMIADNGIGMEKSAVNNIFDKFYRANKKEMMHVSGLGLGLYYAQQCIRIHNWKMLVNSQVGTGSEFIIFIPDEFRTED
ncbi:sensor histidine kinase [Pedobacter sp. SAFR-022]|uniref:sensor histidine kinase n=1 Tax=Pedobacter sp. SAFR-022 TaxID=3436861 RepID=UPI003F815E60